MNNKINNGGPAFPTMVRYGITMRDYFAAKTMQGICSNLDYRCIPKYDLIAGHAYKMADAMLAERAKGE